jgi:hypothetical protein
MKSAHTVSIGACDPGTVNAAWAYTMLQLAQARSSRLGPFIRIEGSGLLSKLRNRVVATFLDHTKSDWLLMIDTDEQLSVQAFDKLIETAHDKDRPVVAGLYFAAWDANENLYPVPVPLISLFMPIQVPYCRIRKDTGYMKAIILNGKVMKIFKKKQTATALPDLERAMQPKLEKRITHGTNKRLLHPIGCKECSCNRRHQ